jgi:hypothetical protein
MEDYFGRMAAQFDPAKTPKTLRRAIDAWLSRRAYTLSDYNAHHGKLKPGAVIMGHIRSGKTFSMIGIAKWTHGILTHPPYHWWLYYTAQTIVQHKQQANSYSRSATIDARENEFNSGGFHYIDDLNLNFDTKELRLLAQHVDDLVRKNAIFVVATNATPDQNESAISSDNEWARLWGRLFERCEQISTEGGLL